MNDLSIADRIRGSLLAGACGDALGAPIEFARWPTIREKFGPRGLRAFAPAYSRTGAITDDTQMTLFTLEALLEAESVDAIDDDLQQRALNAYLRWYRTQSEPYPGDNTQALHGLIADPALWQRRAPGITCLAALERAKRTGLPSPEPKSKGCGGVMRVAPAGYFRGDGFIRGQSLARLTHGHATSGSAAGAFAFLIQRLLFDVRSLQPAISETAMEVELRIGADDETAQMLRLAIELAKSPSIGIPSALAPGPHGGGWVADEALAIAVFCVLAEPDPVEAILRAVNHDGDSDSTGAIAGNILGAAYGADWLPQQWLTHLELQERMVDLAARANALQKKHVDYTPFMVSWRE